MDPSTPFDPVSMIIFSDPDLLVINKPAGLLSIQDGYDRSLPHLATILESIYGKVWIIHRLDKDTSGILLLGRNAETHRYFNEKFKDRSINKTYHAFVLGHPDWNEKMIDLPLKTNADRLHRTRVNISQGKPAVTGFKVINRYPDHTLLECQLYTGYTHQIRAHLFELDLPILGDMLYCQKFQRELLRSKFNFDRIALHAFSIGFEHPKIHQYLVFQAPYPLEFNTSGIHNAGWLRAIDDLAENTIFHELTPLCKV